MPFAFNRVLEPHERRTIGIGATVVGVATVVVLGVLPLTRRWTEREALIAVSRGQVARMETIAGRESEFLEQARAVEARLAASGTRLVRAPTAALAAASLQSVVRDYARETFVTVTRLDAAGAPVAGVAGPLALPASLSVQGDIYGIAEFLQRLQHGRWLLEVTDLAIAPNPVLRGNLLQVTVGLRAPLALEP